MNKELFENTKIATYFLWEYTKSENAMDLWYCAEDMAYYFETNRIEKIEDIYAILRKGKNSFEYIKIIRNLSFRTYIYSKNEDRLSNWFIAERLISNGEWCRAIINMANEFRKNKGNADLLNGIHLETIRQYYI